MRNNYLIMRQSSGDHGRNSKTSRSARLGVGAGLFSIDGAIPTRINTCGIVFRPLISRRIPRPASSSVTCVIGQVANPAIVQSNPTGDSVSAIAVPHDEAVLPVALLY